jgi:DNA-binding CsgD family transcriptional regulator
MISTRKRPSVHAVSSGGQLVGREVEVAELAAALDAAAAGRGGLLLLAGEAGVGKTSLAEHVLTDSGLLVVRGVAAEQAAAPYGPIVQALRDYLRCEPEGLAELGPLRRCLAALLPELGRPGPEIDRGSLLEAVRRAFEVAARARPLAVLLEDLHWADQTTLVDLLPLLAGALENEPVLMLGTYRSDEIPRGHPIRRLRRDLRRAGRSRELALEPLDREGTATLAAGVLGAAVGPSLVTVLYERTQGIPFFVEELSAALAVGGRLREGRAGLALATGGEVPVPDTVRDAIQLRISGLSADARAVLEVAAVAGSFFELESIVELAGEAGLAETIDWGLLVEGEAGAIRFRHALVREAVYAQVPWTRRRELHRGLAQLLDARGARPAVVAAHWLGAHDHRRACPALVEAAEESASVYAYSEALDCARRAAEIWPEGEDEEGRLAVLERVGLCAQLCGNLTEASTAWRELADRRRSAGDTAGTAEALRHLAVSYELQGAWAQVISIRKDAAAAFSRAGLPGEAAADLLGAAGHLDSAGSLRAALELVEWAGAEATRAGRSDLRARALGIEGTVRAKLGELDAGLHAARSGLELALAEDLAAPATDLYQRLANVLENAGDYREAWDVYQTAHGYCEERGEQGAAQVCLVCLGAILFFTAQWDRGIELDREILASPHSPTGVRMGAKQHLGLIAAARGDPKRARRLLDESGAYAERYERERMEVWDALGQAWVDELEGAVDVAVERCRGILVRWRDSESIHYPVPALRWATSFFALRGAERDARAAAAVLTQLAGETTNPEALAAAAHAVGEVALLDGDPELAASHFEQALELLQGAGLPFEFAQTQVRAGAVHGAAGDRELAVERLTAGYLTARRLGARPLAGRAAGELAALGEQVERRLGRRAAAQLDGPGLTRRELEVLRLVAEGQTNREIAGGLFLSTRTVDMHVRNIFSKLGCRSRVEATRKAGELGLIG